MRALWPLLLIFAACGGESDSAVFDDAAVMGRARMIGVASHRAAVRVRNGAAGRIEVAVRYRGYRVDPAIEFVQKGDNGEMILVQLTGELIKREGTELAVSAPAGTGLQVMGADGAVDISGEWTRLDVSTDTGTISARVERADGGELKSHSGSVEFVARCSGPTGEFTAKSISGDVTVLLPAQWNGQIHAATQTGKLDVPPHKNLRTIWDENRKGVIGHVGPQLKKGEPLATVWGTSATGNVSLRLEE